MLSHLSLQPIVHMHKTRLEQGDGFVKHENVHMHKII